MYFVLQNMCTMCVAIIENPKSFFFLLLFARMQSQQCLISQDYCAHEEIVCLRQSVGFESLPQNLHACILYHVAYLDISVIDDVWYKASVILCS